MKKVKLIFILVLVVLSFSGCKKNTEVPENPVTEPVSEIEAELIKATEIPADILELNEVCSYTGDVDGDGADEKILLVTSAERDRSGEFFWNDGQNWALYVDDKDKDYLLYKQYLSAGFPYFEISDYYMNEGTETQIKLIISTGASFAVSNYTFSGTDEGYVKTVVYDTTQITDGGINRRFSSLPEYHTED